MGKREEKRKGKYFCFSGRNICQAIQYHVEQIVPETQHAIQEIHNSKIWMMSKNIRPSSVRISEEGRVCYFLLRMTKVRTAELKIRKRPAVKKNTVPGPPVSGRENTFLLLITVSSPVPSFMEPENSALFCP